jgi:PAT family beta-lactamase induction signal transducer AmpG
MSRRLREIINNPRVVAALTLGFASGLPVNLPGSTLQAWAATLDVDLKTIGWLTLASAPYTFKFLWAPLLDRYFPPLLGRRRGWILLLQLGLAAVIALMGINPPDERLYAISALALLTAFLSASQDVVIDAYRTDVLRVEERGPGSAMTQLGYRIGALLSGAIALMLSDLIGWRNTYFAMAVVMGLTALFTLRAPEPEYQVAPPRTLAEAVIGPLRDFFGRNGAWVLLGLILLYKLGDAFALSLLSTFLIKGVGFTAFEVGAYSKTTLVIATLLGVMVGGAALARLSLWKALLIFGILQAVTNLAYAVLAAAGKNVGVMVMAIGFDNFVGGMGAVAFMAFVMSLCNVRFSAAQYAMLSALALVPRTFLGPPAAWLAETIGWQGLYIVTFLAALPGLAMLWWLRTRIDASNSMQENDG